MKEEVIKTFKTSYNGFLLKYIFLSFLKSMPFNLFKMKGF